MHNLLRYLDRRRKADESTREHVKCRSKSQCDQFQILHELGAFWFELDIERRADCEETQFVIDTVASANIVKRVGREEKCARSLGTEQLNSAASS